MNNSERRFLISEGRICPPACFECESEEVARNIARKYPTIYMVCNEKGAKFYCTDTGLTIKPFDMDSQKYH